ncbi:glycerophosphodiester phosphodiesterase [Brunnivagina elsteri]|uniref:glycerophosphodiester phosphodiesterase n=1 Tax=Brunnivagina elsteri CCALA 953 TaxID=987040 RepID=A0A2A2TF76_9CYAN|nr:glycerophosphodiester phosphodiesterase [Calothrix elsteri]PAX52410.1 glycerophosphodiester phosphodiesterase [Calothrix elsteri CCALA 953]
MQNLPIIIAHRGASGYRPEHTLAAYELAIDMGTDFIEPDLVITKDGVLIARHENEISETTDVASHLEFANRKTTKLIDGELKSGWFSEDFTLAEIKTLRAKERIPKIRPHNTIYDGLYEIPTLQEIIDLAQRKTVETGRRIGIYPETKHPTYFRSLDLALEEPLLEVLSMNGYKGKDTSVFIQSFEVGNLQYLSEKTDLPLVQLLNDKGQPYDFILQGDTRQYTDLVNLEGLKEIANYAQAIGINRNLLVPRDISGKLLPANNLIENAHIAALLIHVWTFRNEDAFLPLDFQGNPQAEYQLFFDLGIDGLFSDNPDLAVKVLQGR